MSFFRKALRLGSSSDSQSLGDGFYPWGGLVLWHDTLYGTTSEGGAFNGGTVFAVNTDGSGFTKPYSLGSGKNDGAYPQTGLVRSGDRLYGTTGFGGTSSCGTVFSLEVRTCLSVVPTAFSPIPSGRAYAPYRTEKSLLTPDRALVASRHGR